MSHEIPYDLGVRRTEWERRAKELLRRSGRQQKTVAADIANGGRPKTTAVNDFVKGDPEALRRWFEDHPEWVDAFVAGTGLSRADLRALVDEVRRGVEQTTSWHAAFPGVGLEEVEIDAVLEGDEPVPQWVGRFNRRNEPITVVGPTGATRDIAVRQLEKQTGQPIAGVEQAPAGVSGVRLGAWGSTQVVALARRLAGAGAIESAARRYLRDFADQVERDPSLVGPARTPGLAIGLLEQVAADGPPKSAREARRHLSRSAWLRAARFSDHLTDVDERLCERLFAGLARRSRASEEPGGWCVAPRSEVVRLVGDALRDLYGALDPDAVIVAAREAAKTRKDHERESAWRALHQQLRRPPAEPIVDDLVDRGILVAERWTAARTLRAAEPALAAVWAARGLEGSLPPLGDFARLVDPGWGLVVEELATNGLASADLATALATAPPELGADADLWLLRHAAAAPREPIHPAVSRAWARLTWTVAAAIDAPFVSGYYRWTLPTFEVVRRASWALRHALPRLGNDPLATLRAHVPGGTIDGPAPHPDRVRVLAVGQNDVATEAGRAWWRTDARGVALLLERAELGDGPCREVAGGHHPSDELWKALPLATKLRWAVVDGPTGEPGAELWRRLVGGRDHTDQTRAVLVEWAVELGAEQVGWMVASSLRSLCDGFMLPPHDPGFWFDLAVRLDLREALRRLANPRWLIDSRLDEHGIELQTSEGERYSLASVLESGERATDGLTKVLRRRNELALRAAKALYELGERDPLLDWWRDGRPAPPEPVRAGVERVSGLLWLLSLPLASWGALPRGVLDELGTFSASPTRADATDRRWRPWSRAVLPRAESMLQACGREHVAPALTNAIDGANALLSALPQDLPPTLDGFLRWNGRMPLSDRGTIPGLRALFELRALEPIVAWLEQPVPPSELGREVESALEQDPRYLSAAWELARCRADRPHHRASLVRIAARLAIAHPVAVEAALADPAAAQRMADANEDQPGWLPVLRRDLSLDGRVRTPLRAAVAILRRAPSDPEAQETLRRWAIATDPFAHGWDWYPTDDGWMGGGTKLLAAVLTLTDAPWRLDALAHLWAAVRGLPFRPGSELQLDVDAPPDTAWLRMEKEPPNELRDLANALCAAGSAAVVVAAMPRVAEDETRRWQDWLAPWFLAHADPKELGWFVREAPVHLVTAARKAWLERARLVDPREVAEHLARRVGDAWLLMHAAPERLEQLGWEDAAVADAANIPGLEHLPTLLALRRRGVR